MMTESANEHDKPSPSDTPTDRPNDNGGKAVKKSEDKDYDEKDANLGNVAKQRENSEAPVNPVKTPPDEFADPEKDNPPVEQ